MGRWECGNWTHQEECDKEDEDGHTNDPTSNPAYDGASLDSSGCRGTRGGAGADGRTLGETGEIDGEEGAGLAPDGGGRERREGCG